MTQAELAARSGFPRETIARWEGGGREPSLSSLERLVAAAGLDLTVSIAEGDTSLDELVARQLRVSPRQRLAALLPPDQLRGASDALKWLAGADAAAIVIGPVAAALQGAPQRPGDGTVDIVPADLELMATELADGDFEPQDNPERWAATDRRWEWKRNGSSIVLSSALPGSGGYKDLRRAARYVKLTAGAHLRVAHPRDLLRLAEASSRADERARAPGLRALLDQIDDADE